MHHYRGQRALRRGVASGSWARAKPAVAVTLPLACGLSLSGIQIPGGTSDLMPVADRISVAARRTKKISFLLSQSASMPKAVNDNM